MAEVFVSYRRGDQQSVRQLVEALRATNFAVWWDEDIPADAPWEATIEQELNAARVVLVAWSRAAVSSENVRAEARSAKQSGKLIQVFVERCEPPLFFGERQGIDLTNWSGDQTDPRFGRVIAGIRKVASGLPEFDAQAPNAGSHRQSGVARWIGLAATLVALTVAGFAWVRTSTDRAALDGLEGTWGRPGCPAPQRFSVARDRITVSAPGWSSVGHVVSINGDTVLSETITPLAERGRLVELRANGDSLIIHDKTTDVQQVLERCP